MFEDNNNNISITTPARGKVETSPPLLHGDFSLQGHSEYSLLIEKNSHFEAAV
jgi:hypothetical protein